MRYEFPFPYTFSAPDPSAGDCFARGGEMSRHDGLIVANIWSINAQGNPTFTQTVSKYDGKEYGQYNQTTLETFQATGTQTANTQAFAIVDAYTVDITNKVDGRVSTTSRRTVSEDGKTMTHALEGAVVRPHRGTRSPR